LPRVLVFSPEFPPFTTGGLGMHLSALGSGLVARGWSVDVVVPSGGAGAESFEAEGVRVHLLSPGAATRSHHPSSLRYKKAYKEDILARSLEIARDRSGAVDLVHAHDWYLAPVAERASGALRVPWILTTHLLFGAVFRSWGNVVPSEIVAIEEAACKSADRVIAVSHAMGDLVVKTYGIPASRVLVVHNGIDPASASLFRSVPDVEKESLVVFTGRMTRQKGLLPLLESAVIVHAAVPEARWLLVGPVADPIPDPRSLALEIRAFLAARPALAARVEIAGPWSRPRIAEAYSRAAVAVVPSIYESFGYAALEAMAAGVPVVASDVGGLPEIVDDVVTGFLIPMTDGDDGRRTVDVHALAERQVRLLRDPALARRMGAAGRVRAIESFPPARMVTETEAVYRDVLRSAAT
jgi:glycosyltransferase involved in cell wall biosynthesis